MMCLSHIQIYDSSTTLIGWLPIELEDFIIFSMKLIFKTKDCDSQF